jgi:hypothetical protein
VQSTCGVAPRFGVAMSCYSGRCDQMPLSFNVILCILFVYSISHYIVLGLYIVNIFQHLGFYYYSMRL